MNKNISSIQYNSLNLPSSITYQNGNMTGYAYNSAGVKLTTSHTTGGVTATTQYCGSAIYDDGALSQLLINGGYITFSGTTPAYHFYLQDHLGSNRVVVSQGGTVEQVNHYYPFGGIIADISSEQNVQPYKYNGKELDRMHGLDTYDYGARQYNPITAHWDRVDPLCEEYYSMSPYNYCGNNPISFVDLKGLEPGDFFKTKDEAAKDFGLFYNDNSIRENKEYGSSIFEIIDKTGTTWYSYSIPSIGIEGETIVSDAPLGTKRVATIHTHGAFSYGKYRDNEFSGIRNEYGDFLSKEERAAERGPNDIGNANRRGLDSYVVTPNGSLVMYNQKENKIISLSSDMPYDPNDGTQFIENTNNALFEAHPTTEADNLRMLRKILYHNPNNP